MNFFDLANLLDNDGNLQNEMMVMSFAATLLATIPVRLAMIIRFVKLLYLKGVQKMFTNVNTALNVLFSSQDEIFFIEVFVYHI